MKSAKTYIHFLWMFLFCGFVATAQDIPAIPTGYASTVKEALRDSSLVSSISIYYTKGLVYSIEEGKHMPDAPIEKIGAISQLKQVRLHGCPVDFKQQQFFNSIAGLKKLEVLELRMDMKQLGLLSPTAITALKQMKTLKRLTLPADYPDADYLQLQKLLPNCEIVTSMNLTSL